MFNPVIVSRHKKVANDISIWQGDVGDFGQDESREIVFVISPPKSPEECMMRDLLGAGYHVEKLPEGNVYIVTARVQKPDKFSIYHTPFVGSSNCAPSPTSDAFYHLQYSVTYCGILWQRLVRPHGRRYAQTSSHCHSKQREKWLVLSGNGALLSRPHDRPNEPWHTTAMRKGDCLGVLPGVDHQLRTDDSNFSTLLVMTGHPDGFSMTDHVYVEPPPANMVIA